MGSLSVTLILLAAGLAIAVLGVVVGKIFTGTIHAMERREKALRVAGICLLSIGIFVGIVAFSDVKPPSPGWIKGEAAGLKAARAAGHPALLDFWADWCAACKDLDRDFFTREDVKAALTASAYIPVKVDLTRDSQENEAINERYAITGLPTFALVDPRTTPPTQVLLNAKALADPDGTLCTIQRFPTEGASAVKSCAAGGGDGLESALQGNLFLALLLVFLGGIASSFTPCVYPMIPITVAVFGAKDSGSRLRSFLLSLTYVGGIALTFTILGLVAAWTGGLFGKALQSPWVVGGIALVLVALGLSMVGLYPLRIPAAVQARLGNVGGEGWGGAFALGLVAGVIFAPCVGPVLVTLLAHIAQERDLFLGAVLMMDYALGMGVLFLVLGTFSGAITRRPRAGNWLEGVEVSLGCLLLAMALFYLKDIIPPLKAFVPAVQSILQA